MENLLREQLEAFEKKDYARADELRDYLKKQGVMIYNVKNPETLERFTFWQKDGVTKIFPHEVSREEYELLKRSMKKKK